VHTELIQASRGSSQGRDAAAIGTTTGIGAIIGATAAEGDGAAIGAAAGAAAGIAGVLSTRGRPTELHSETLLTFRLIDPATITTQQAQQAFRPVSQADYGNTSIVS
jgi:outer membrane lipoprotein SlyB